MVAVLAATPIHGSGRNPLRSAQVGVADRPQDVGAAAVGGPGDELVVVGGAAVEGGGADDVLVVEEAEVALEAVGRVDGAGGDEVVALAAVAVDGVEVAHEPAGDVAWIRTSGVDDEALDGRTQIELVGHAVGVPVA